MIVNCNKIVAYRNFHLITKVLVVSVICILFSRCVEPFEAELEDFENFLVVNSTVTNEVKHHQVFLSRTFKFEDDGPIKEENATVKVIENGTVEYLFEETSAGVYQSVQEFAIVTGREYQLSIKTSNGKSYISEKETLPDETPIQEVSTRRILNDNNEMGIGIIVNTFDVNGNSKYYRYEFEETYRYNAPFWRQYDIEINGEIVLDPFINYGFDLVQRSEELKTCYVTNSSNSILINSTNNLEEGMGASFLLNFIKTDDIRLEDRYSILVRQFVQTRETYNFYEQLKTFSESESLFSQVQPGFIKGNIVSESNENEPVVGIFEASSITKNRIFFNREDVVEVGDPIYVEPCKVISLKQGRRENLIDFLRRVKIVVVGKNLLYHSWLLDIPEFNFVPKSCGDCTEYGKNAPPDFWED
ncbi:DUF4249 domain-containing protein [Aquimarina sp. 2201CG1-2-11]|uniref:DUF4249 domain-containing protein n=1 Tax=Aquimarina discodermiae TaxID=3231043 RepID=UPI003461A5B1